jgi:RHS repeat-associated protein
MGARAYASDLAAWTSPDPLAISSPEQLVGRSLASANPYAYGAQNPVTRVDADGHTDTVAIGSAASAFFTAARVFAGVSAGTALATVTSPVIVLTVIAVAPVAYSAYVNRNGNPSTEPTGTVAPVPALQPDAVPPPPPLVPQAPSTSPPPSVAAPPSTPTTHVSTPQAPAAPVTHEAREVRGPTSVKQISPDKIKSPPKRRGDAPIGIDGHPIEIHHVGQEPYGEAEEMTRTDHRLGPNYKTNHPNGNEDSQIDRNEFNRWKKQYWEQQWDSGRWCNGQPQQLQGPMGEGANPNSF